jgi:hypothetical protein
MKYCRQRIDVMANLKVGVIGAGWFGEIVILD